MSHAHSKQSLPIAERLHMARRETVWRQFQTAVAQQKDLKLHATEGEELALWAELSREIFTSVYDMSDRISDPRTAAEHDRFEHAQMQRRFESQRTYHIDEMLRNGLCDTKNESIEQLLALEKLAQHVTQEVHADDKQRTDLRGRKPEPGQQSRIRGRFTKAFRPEDPAIGSFHEMLLHAKNNAPVMKEWNLAFETEGRRLWEHHPPFIRLNNHASQHPLPEPRVVCQRMYEHLAAQHAIPPFGDPAPEDIPQLLEPKNQGKTVIAHLRESGHYDDAVSVVLLRGAQREMGWQAQQSMQRFWNADKVGGEPAWNLQRQRLMREEMELKAAELTELLLPVAAKELASERARDQFSADLYQMLAVANNAAMRFAREGAGLRNGRSV